MAPHRVARRALAGFRLAAMAPAAGRRPPVNPRTKGRCRQSSAVRSTGQVRTLRQRILPVVLQQGRASFRHFAAVQQEDPCDTTPCMTSRIWLQSCGLLATAIDSPFLSERMSGCSRLSRRSVEVAEGITVDRQMDLGSGCAALSSSISDVRASPTSILSRWIFMPPPSAVRLYCKRVSSSEALRRLGRPRQIRNRPPPPWNAFHSRCTLTRVKG